LADCREFSYQGIEKKMEEIMKVALRVVVFVIVLASGLQYSFGGPGPVPVPPEPQTSL
jgi:hypothetical protein